MESLANYLALRQRVDAHGQAVEKAHGPDIACRRGCDACCRHLNIFPVEAAALRLALNRLSAGQVETIRKRAKSRIHSLVCPLLQNRACALYPDRPLICRTHGLPLLLLRDGRRQVDVCPKNFTRTASLTGDALIDLEALNTALAAVNALFVQAVFPGADRDWRPSIAEALMAESVTEIRPFAEDGCL